MVGRQERGCLGEGEKMKTKTTTTTTELWELNQAISYWNEIQTTGTRTEIIEAKADVDKCRRNLRKN